MDFEYLIVGAGFSGAVLAERIASQSNKKIMVIEKRDHVGGNCYDKKDKNDILVHKYGPHIFHTDCKEVWDYLSRFTEWIPYQHKVLGFIDGRKVTLPFNLNTLHELIPERLVERLERKLINNFGFNNKIPILEFKKIKDEDLKFLADFIYEKIFLHYTEKQWGLKPEEIESSVTARVPVVISYDDRYFHDRYQGIPKLGYTKLFEKMLQNPNIELLLGKDFKNIRRKLKVKKIFYTGAIDSFFNYQYGKLAYRCVDIDFQSKPIENYQPAAVVNYPNDYDYTRITEFKKFTSNKSQNTTIGVEYPGNKGFMAWPVLNEKNKKIFREYWKEAEKLKSENIYFIGRLAEYKYYDMDDAIANALKIFKCAEYD